MLCELQVKGCCGLGQFGKGPVCGRKGRSNARNEVMWESGGWHSDLALSLGGLPWQMICQCSVFLEREYRDIACDFIVQLVPLAFLSCSPPNTWSWYTVVTWSCYTTFLSCSEPSHSGTCHWEEFLLPCSLHVDVLMPCCHPLFLGDRL